MKNTYIIIIIIVLVAMVSFFGLRGKEVVAPADGESNKVEEGGVVSNTMPILGESNVEEMVVNSQGEVEVKEFIVSGKNFSFSPSLIAVKKGDRVKIIFKNTAGFHDFVIDEFGAATKQGQAPFEEVLEFTADKVGSFEYYCSVGSHRSMGMFGTLKVTE